MKKLPKEIVVRWVDLGPNDDPYLSANEDETHLCGDMNPGDTATIGHYRLVDIRKVAAALVKAKP